MGAELIPGLLKSLKILVLVHIFIHLLEGGYLYCTVVSLASAFSSFCFLNCNLRSTRETGAGMKPDTVLCFPFTMIHIRTY